jgi:hypothetical protein
MVKKILKDHSKQSFSKIKKDNDMIDNRGPDWK